MTVRSENRGVEVLLVSRNYPPDRRGGGEAVAFQLAEGLRAHFDLRVVTQWRTSPRAFPGYVSSVKQPKLGRPLGYIRLFRFSSRCARAYRPRIFHAMTPEVPEVTGRSIATVHHLGHLLTASSTSAFGPVRRIQRQLLRRRLSGFDRIVAPSRATADDLQRHFGVANGRVGVIPWGIRSVEPQVTVAHHRGNADPLNLLVPSRVSREKGQDVALQALRELEAESKGRFKMTIAGFPSQAGYLHELQVQGEGLPVEFCIGPDELQMDRLYSEADLVLFPTRIEEGFGLVAGEALAHSKPLIASSSRAVREVAGEDATYVPAGDVGALARAVHAVAGNLEDANLRGQRGATRMRSSFTWPRTISAYCQEYEKLLEGAF